MAGNQFGNKSIGEREWKPHNLNIANKQCTEKKPDRVPGPDWTSSLRCMQSKQIENDRSVKIEKQDVYVGGRRHFPWKCEQTENEWKYYSDGSSYGKKCIIDGYYHGNVQTNNEVKLENIMGCHRQVPDCRGGLPCRSPGDKIYAVPEYSADFHKVGSTLPAVNFGQSCGFVTDTFIPLQPLPRQPSETFKQKECTRILIEEKEMVKGLSNWEPAAPIDPALL